MDNEAVGESSKPAAPHATPAASSASDEYPATSGADKGQTQKKKVQTQKMGEKADKSGDGDAITLTGLFMQKSAPASVNARRRSLTGDSGVDTSTSTSVHQRGPGVVGIGEAEYAADKNSFSALEGLNMFPGISGFGGPDGGVDMLALPPDPPCIKYEEIITDVVANKKEKDSSVSSYWKQHASWLEFWPQTQEARDNTDDFLRGYKAAGEEIKAYVNVAEVPVGLRSEAQAGEEFKNGDIMQPGEIALSNQSVYSAGRRFFKIVQTDDVTEERGFVFENQDGGKPAVAEMVRLEVGPWWYRIMCDEHVEIRSAPAYSQSLRTGWMLSPKEVFVVRFRCNILGHQFLKLADGRGWVFSMKPGVKKHEAAQNGRVAQECDADLEEGKASGPSLQSLLPATNMCVQVGYWLYVVNREPVLAVGGTKYGTWLSPGEYVEIDKICTAHGDKRQAVVQDLTNQLVKTKVDFHSRNWLRLLDGRGWVPEIDIFGKKLLEEEKHRVDKPEHQEGGRKSGSEDDSAKTDRPKELWMVGVA